MNTAYQFWASIDSLLKMLGITNKEMAQKGHLDYNTVKSWRAKLRIPGSADLWTISKVLGVSMEYLLTGESSQEPALSPRIQAVVSCLEDDEDKLCAVETLLGLGKKASPLGGVPKGTVGA